MNYLLLSRVKSPRMRFGQWVRARRREMGLTQQALAAKAGNQQSRISDIERGMESLTREEVGAIGAVLGDSERAVEIWIRPPNPPPHSPTARTRLVQRRYGRAGRFLHRARKYLSPEGGL